MGMVISITTWPAHEAVLAFSSKGLGVNALSTLNVVAFVLFLAWSVVLWSPLFLMKHKGRRWIGIFAQVVILLAISGLFWKYGNG